MAIAHSRAKSLSMLLLHLQVQLAKFISFSFSGELFGTFLIVASIDSIGRKFTLMGAFAVLAVLFPMFYICLPSWLNTALVFLFRALISGGYQVVWVYTPEIYPTDVRSFGSSLCVFISRYGSVVLYINYITYI
jgi:hypothetical protein